VTDVCCSVYVDTIFTCVLCQPAASIQLKYQLTTSGQK